MNPRTWIPVALLAVLSSVACQELVEPLADPPDLEGTVMNVSLDGLGLPNIGMVVVRASFGHDENDDRPRRIFLQGVIEGPVAAVFVRKGDGAAEEAAPSDITVGDRVEIWTEVELRSDPPQYIADQVIIIRD